MVARESSLTVSELYRLTQGRYKIYLLDPRNKKKAKFVINNTGDMTKDWIETRAYLKKNYYVRDIVLTVAKTIFVKITKNP